MSQAPYPPGGYAYGPGQGYQQPGQPQVGFAPQQGYGPAPPQQQGYGSFNVAFEGRVDRPTYSGSDVPAQDMFDNQFAKAPVPSAPPADMFAQYSGYENTRFGSSFVPPPPPYVPPPSSEMPEQLFQQSTAISDDQARDAMLQFVSEHCCYGKTPAQEMVIKDIVPSSAYHYSLASFCESRKTEWQYEPYRGQPIDSPVNGPAPLPWNIPAQPQQMFSDFQTKLEVPHTANIKMSFFCYHKLNKIFNFQPCHDCLAVGYIRCYKCCGRGRLRCSRCQGSGFVQEGMEQVQCNICFARGWKMCDLCNGHGRVKCWTCMGNAQLKTFIELTVKWENNVSHHVVGRTEQLPSELIVNSQGTEIFSQELPRVWPISTFFDQQVNMGSKRLVEEHSNKWPAKRILMQRHVLRAVPVSEVHYQWNDFASRFWVFGHDHKVYAPDYPQKCCCGCSIL
ncbi:unnamed protein product [Porites lobata]|uniref:Ssu-2 homolog n=1 Tax=Porites lobata TaxID=104759 RepID=A0ABN8RQE8_9CNID|nr:unnamed protein product [Porites lobata]